MAKIVKVKSKAAIDTVLPPKKIAGMQVKSGKVSKMRDDYYLTVGSKKLRIPMGVVPEKDIASMVNKEVNVVFAKGSNANIVAVGTWPTPENPISKKKWITCYIPIPYVRQLLDPAIRELLIDEMLKEKIITKELAAEVRRNY